MKKLLYENIDNFKVGDLIAAVYINYLNKYSKPFGIVIKQNKTNYGIYWLGNATSNWYTGYTTYDNNVHHREAFEKISK